MSSHVRGMLCGLGITDTPLWNSTHAALISFCDFGKYLYETIGLQSTYVTYCGLLAGKLVGLDFAAMAERTVLVL